MLAPSPFWIYVTSLTLLCLEACSSSYVRLNKDGGYTDIVIAISPSVAESEGVKLILNLEKLFQATSNLLHSATNQHGHPLFFQQLVFLIPPSWTLKTDARQPTYYQKSDIRVIEDDKPGISTVQMGGCTEPGEFIQLTSSFVTESKNGAQQLLQHWARYRYGIFPEEGDGSSPIYPTQYRDQNGAQKTGCATPNPWTRHCLADNTGKCTFTRNNSVNVESSIMDVADLQAKFFCDKATHNPEAPTIHNVLCDRKSVWEILEKHEDFGTGTSTTPSPPNITSIKVTAKPLQVVLVIDHHFCELNNQSEVVRLAVGNALKHLFPDTEIGIVFANYEKSQIREVKSGSALAAEEWRNLSAVNYNASYNDKDFYRAVREGVKFLKTSFNLTEDGVLIALAKMDHRSNIEQFTNEVKLAIATGTGVDSYLITYQAKVEEKEFDAIQKFSKDTTWYNVDLLGLETWKQTDDALRDIINRYDTDFQPSNTQIISEIFPPNNPRKFFVSSSTSNFTVLSHYIDDSGELLIDELPIPFTEDKATKTKAYSTNLAEGVHTIQVNTYEAYVTIDALSAEESLSFIVEIKESNDIKIPHIIHSSIRHKNIPVLDADIRAVLISSKEPIEEFQLIDSGNGDPDVLLDDGIYSRYIVPSKAGVYQVVVKLYRNQTSPEANQEAVITYADDDRSLIPVSKSFGSFYFAGKAEDYPPNRILDFRLAELTHETGSVTFAWTAPGANYDQGQASKYEVKCSTCSDTVADKDSFNRHEFQTDDMNPPLPAGTQETLKWTISHDNSNNGKLLYCAIRAENKNGDKNLPSNVVAFQIFVPQPTTTTLRAVITTTATTTITENATEPAAGVATTPRNELLEKIWDAVVGGVVTIVLLLLILIGLVAFFIWRQFYRHPGNRVEDLPMHQTTSQVPRTQTTSQVPQTTEKPRTRTTGQVPPQTDERYGPEPGGQATPRKRPNTNRPLPVPPSEEAAAAGAGRNSMHIYATDTAGELYADTLNISNPKDSYSQSHT